MEIKGRDLVAGIPKVVVTTGEEVREALVEPLAQIVETVHLTLERTPPELAADIVDRGIMLVGGGSMLKDLDQVLRQETKLPILRSEDPFTAVVNGAGRRSRTSTAAAPRSARSAVSGAGDAAPAQSGATAASASCIASWRSPSSWMRPERNASCGFSRPARSSAYASRSTRIEVVAGAAGSPGPKCVTSAKPPSPRTSKCTEPTRPASSSIRACVSRSSCASPESAPRKPSADPPTSATKRSKDAAFLHEREERSVEG